MIGLKLVTWKWKCLQGSQKNPTESCDRLITTDYNHTFTEWSKYIYIYIYLAFFGIIDRTSYTGQNYRANTIIIVHLATLPLCWVNFVVAHPVSQVISAIWEVLTKPEARLQVCVQWLCGTITLVSWTNRCAAFGYANIHRSVLSRCKCTQELPLLSH